MLEEDLGKVDSPSMCSGDHVQVTGLGGKPLYQLGHLTTLTLNSGTQILGQQEGKALPATAKSGDWTFIPRSHVIKRENQFLHAHHGTHPSTYTINQYNAKNRSFIFIHCSFLSENVLLLFNQSKLI